MKQKYILYILFSFFISISGIAQEKKNNTTKNDGIEGLQIFPNPVTTGRIYISTDQNSNSREIEIYDMLGKKVYEITLYGNNKEVNISNLNSGIYLIKVKENNTSATRKLVIK